MKKIYGKPEMDIVVFEVSDVITTSGTGEEQPTARTLKTSIAGKEGSNYGQQSVSIYD